MVKYAWGISVIDADHDKDLIIIIFSDLDYYRSVGSLVWPPVKIVSQPPKEEN